MDERAPKYGYQVLLLQFPQMAQVWAVMWGLETGEVYGVITVS